MAQFEDQQGDATDISRQIAKMLIVLGIDWNDPAAMRELAREALSYKGERASGSSHTGVHIPRAKLELFGLVGLMFKTMEEGAENGSHIHGSEVWKAMAKALWEQKQLKS